MASIRAESHENLGMEMELSWTASEPVSGRLSAERRSSAEDYTSWMETLLALGEGYSEVSRDDQLYPRVSLAFRAGYGVIAYWSSSEQMLLLVGDGIISNDGTVFVPGLEGDAKYSGAFVSSQQRAWDTVTRFIESGSLDGVGQWVQL
jgi:hypothetical protein